MVRDGQSTNSNASFGAVKFIPSVTCEFDAMVAIMVPIHGKSWEITVPYVSLEPNRWMVSIGELLYKNERGKGCTYELLRFENHGIIC